MKLGIGYWNFYRYIVIFVQKSNTFLRNLSAYFICIINIINLVKIRQLYYFDDVLKESKYCNKNHENPNMVHQIDKKNKFVWNVFKYSYTIYFKPLV